MIQKRTKDREDRFVNAIMEGKGQTDAYLAISPNAAKWAKVALDVKASALMARPRVQELLAKRRAQAAEIAVLRAADIMEETRRIALSTPAGVIDRATGKVKLPHELDAATAATIQSFEIDDLGRVKYRFWDKNNALERGAKILGMFREDNEQNRPTVFIDRIELVPLRPLPAKK